MFERHKHFPQGFSFFILNISISFNSGPRLVPICSGGETKKSLAGDAREQDRGSLPWRCQLGLALDHRHYDAVAQPWPFSGETHPKLGTWICELFDLLVAKNRQ
jgi:hypothetical protein